MATLTIYYGADKPIKVHGSNACRLVSFAEKYRGWHTAAKDRATRNALAVGERAGCLERNEFGQFRFCYPS